jgi:glycerol uptake facilitator-like aquaporin
MMRRLLAEGLGALLLAAAVIGSGIMAERLADGSTAVALLANTGATVAALAVLIALFGPMTGAHFNPVITLVATTKGSLPGGEASAYIAVQVVGCCLGAILANVMFELPLLQFSLQPRTGIAQWLSEVVATAGLVLVAFTAPTVTEAAWRVPAWIGAAYWFTASTSFANPAITIGRTLTDTFTGIRPIDAVGFILAQIAGGFLGFVATRVFQSGKAEAR